MNPFGRNTSLQYFNNQMKSYIYVNVYILNGGESLQKFFLLQAQCNQANIFFKLLVDLQIILIHFSVSDILVCFAWFKQHPGEQEAVESKSYSSPDCMLALRWTHTAQLSTNMEARDYILVILFFCHFFQPHLQTCCQLDNVWLLLNGDQKESV